MEPLFSLASTITAIPRWRSCSASPMPECIRIVGLWTVLANSTTSPAMIVSRPWSISSTPTARLFSTRMRTTVLPVRRVTRREAQVRTGISVYRAASPLVRDRRSLCNSDTGHAVISSKKNPGPLCTPALISFTSSKQHGTPLYRSSCARKPRPLFRADMFQPLDAPRLVPRTAMYPRNPLACRQPSLELFDFR